MINKTRNKIYNAIQQCDMANYGSEYEVFAFDIAELLEDTTPDIFDDIRECLVEIGCV